MPPARIVRAGDQLASSEPATSSQASGCGAGGFGPSSAGDVFSAAAPKVQPLAPVDLASAPDSSAGLSAGPRFHRLERASTIMVDKYIVAGGQFCSLEGVAIGQVIELDMHKPKAELAQPEDDAAPTRPEFTQPEFSQPEDAAAPAPRDRDAQSAW